MLKLDFEWVADVKQKAILSNLVKHTFFNHYCIVIFDPACVQKGVPMLRSTHGATCLHWDNSKCCSLKKQTHSQFVKNNNLRCILQLPHKAQTSSSSGARTARRWRSWLKASLRASMTLVRNRRRHAKRVQSFSCANLTLFGHRQTSSAPQKVKL